MKQVWILECKRVWKWLRYFILALVLLQLPVLFVAAMGYSEDVFLNVFATVEMIGFYLLIPIQICIFVRYFRTHVGRQTAFYLTLPLSPMRLFWGQSLAWSVGMLFYLLVEAVLLVLVVSVRTGFGWLAALGSNISWDPNLSPLFLAVGIFVVVLYFIGNIVECMILQVYGDDRWSRLGVGGPILATVVFYLISFAAAILVLVVSIAAVLVSLSGQGAQSGLLVEAFADERILHRLVYWIFGGTAVVTLLLIGISYALLSNSHRKHLQV